MTVDAGNIYDRGDRYDYVSPPFDAGVGAQFRIISWQGDAPFRTRLEFQIRTAASREQLESGVWTGPVGQSSVFRTPGGKLTGIDRRHRWIQYKACLVSPDSVNTPVLRSVEVGYGDSE